MPNFAGSKTQRANKYAGLRAPQTPPPGLQPGLHRKTTFCFSDSTFRQVFQKSRGCSKLLPAPAAKHKTSVADKYRGSHNYSSAGKKEAPHSRRLRLQSKNFCLQRLFPSACSIHAFISAASVLKSFSKTTSISSTLCRPSFM